MAETGEHVYHDKKFPHHAKRTPARREEVLVMAEKQRMRFYFLVESRTSYTTQKEGQPAAKTFS